MKKGIIFLYAILLLGMIPVHAANYEMRELIPVGVETTIRAESLLYQKFSYEDGVITFSKIKNNSNEEKPLTISIGLFNSKKKNIGTINYCSTENKLSPKEEKENFQIEVTSKYLEEEKTTEDVKYIAILSDNSSCRIDGAYDFLGQKVEKIGQIKNTSVTDSAIMLLNMLKVIAIILFILFLYKFLFTNAYRNINGDDVRQEYAYINKQLRKEREEKAKNEKPEPKVVKTHKTKEIIDQEKIQNEKDLKDDSDLHNFYR